MVKIAFVDTLGLSYDGDTLKRRGLGGSESAIIYMSRELAKIGFQVTVFNDCASDDNRPGVYDNVTYRPLREVETDPTHYDVVIGSRSVATFAPPEIKDQFKNFLGGLPDFSILLSRAKHKVLYMHDTFCDGDNYIETFINQGRINEIFTLTDWHTSYVSNCNHGVYRNYDILKNHIFQTRNAIGIKPDWVDIKAKDPFLFVYNSSVTKGMVPLVTRVWPVIQQHFPQAKLTVIGGYYKFRDGAAPDQQEQDWHKLVAQHPNVNFTGIIPQYQISDILVKASFMLYPAAFPETFGISTLEALAHNVPILTCRFGALEETAIDAASYKINYTVEKNWSCQWLNEDEQINHFIQMTLNVINNRYLHQQKMYACNQVKDICTWDTVALQWKQHLYKKLGLFLPINDYKKVTKINQRVRKVFGRRFTNPEENYETKEGPYNKITVVSPVYNAEKYVDKCILSVAQQDYPNYKMIIIDDSSTDSTLKVIDNTIDSLDSSIRDRFIVIANVENRGAVCNHVTTIRDYTGDDIVMLLDGDDWLVNDPSIFHKYNNIYNDGAEFTYGSCWSVVDNIPLIAQEYPPEVKASKSYRQYRFNWNMPYTHLRTFRASLMHSYLHHHGYRAFKNANGDWHKAGGDTAVFYAMIETADPDKVICVPDIVYNYNDANPLCDFRVNGETQNITAAMVLGDIREQFSVVVPTMWRCPVIFQQALQRYITSPYVSDIVIINNDPVNTPDWSLLKNPKVHMHTRGHNIRVNPAWNLGVTLAAQDRIAIVNDDIVFDSNVFARLQGRIAAHKPVHGIITGEPHFNHPATTDKSISFMEWKPDILIHGFGQAFFVHRANWPTIPDDITLFFGDDIVFQYHLHRGMTPVLIYNIDFESPMASTTKDKSISGGFLEKEKPLFMEWAKQYPYTVKTHSPFEPNQIDLRPL
jgi:glycosyltransferase involved in cell wall biosynthesis